MGRDGAETDALHSSRPTSNPRHQADAVLCGRPHDTALRPDADALLDALPAGTQHLLATAFLTSEHEVALTRRFRRAGAAWCTGVACCADSFSSAAAVQGRVSSGWARSAECGGGAGRGGAP